MFPQWCLTSRMTKNWCNKKKVKVRWFQSCHQTYVVQPDVCQVPPTPITTPTSNSNHFMTCSVENIIRPRPGSNSTRRVPSENSTNMAKKQHCGSVVILVMTSITTKRTGMTRIMIILTTTVIPTTINDDNKSWKQHWQGPRITYKSNIP